MSPHEHTKELKHRMGESIVRQDTIVECIIIGLLAIGSVLIKGLQET